MWLQLYAKSDKCNPKTCTFCCRHCPNCNRSSFSQIDLEIDFEQDKSMTIRGSAPCGEVHLNKSVIDLSMKQLIQKVSLTGSLQRGRNHVGRCIFTKVSLTSQWQFTEGSSPCGEVHLYKSVIDQSMTVLKHPIQKVSLTGQWQFSKGSTPCGEVHLYKSVIDRSMTVYRGVDTMWGGAPLQKCHWPVNDSSETAH